jgi:hypothetical protein
MAQHFDSRLTQRAFAQREGITFSTLTAWVQGRRFAGKPGRKGRFAEMPMILNPAAEKRDGNGRSQWVCLSLLPDVLKVFIRSVKPLSAFPLPVTPSATAP